jgi:NitT/TauT family transport system substrate-binding protein
MQCAARSRAFSARLPPACLVVVQIVGSTARRERARAIDAGHANCTSQRRRTSAAILERAMRITVRALLSRGLLALVVLLTAGLAASPVRAADARPEFKVAWSIYVGWMPWDYAQQSGILKKWADKYGIKITLTQVNDYVESINQYTAGQFDACVMTNMDMLTIPAAGGVDSTALITGDFSNGNDGIILKGKGKKLADIKGQSVNLVELSVSHYVLARALETLKLRERDVKIVNTSDADIVGAWAAPATTAVVTWKPQLSEIGGQPDASLVFDSSKLPGEIIDLMVVKTDVLKKSPALGKALVGAWYETLTVMFGKDAAATAALTAMAKASGTDIAGFRSQLATTRMFATPAEAHTFMQSPDVSRTMDLVRKFSFEHGILGEGAKTVDAVGISFPSGQVLGDSKNVKMRFDATYTKLAVDGKL